MSSIEVARLLARFELDATNANAQVAKTVKGMEVLDRALAAVDSSSNKLQAEINASNKTQRAAAQAIDKTSDALARLEAELKKTARAFDAQEAAATNAADAQKKHSEKFSKAIQGYFFVASALRDVGQAFTAVYDAAQEGARIAAAESFFKNSGKDIESYREATKGLVSDSKLMKKANLADSMGISEPVFKQLVTVARAAALKTGQSFEYMFDSIVVGTARSSRLLLDNLGIIVSVKEANEKYAATLGKTVEELTAQERQIAFSNEVMVKSQGQIKELADTNTTAAASFEALGAQSENFSDRVKKALASMTAESASSMATFLTNVNTSLDGLKLLSPTWHSRLLSMWDASMASMALALNVLLGGIPLVLRGAMGGFGDAAQAGADLAKGAKEEQRIEAAKNTFDAYDAIKAYLSSQGTGKVDGATLDKIIQDYYDGATEIDGALEELLFTFKTFNDQAKSFGFGPTQAAAPEVYDVPGAPTRAEAKALRGGNKIDKPKKEKDPEAGSMYGNIALDVIDFEAQLKEAEDAAKELTAAHKKAKKAADDLDKDRESHLKKLNELDIAARKEKIKQDAADAKARAEKTLDQANSVANVTTDIAGGGGIFGPIGAALGPVVTAALAPIMGPLAGIIGGLIPVIGAMMDALDPVIKLVSAIVDGLTLLVSNGLLEALWALLGPLTEGLRGLLATIGVVIGSALRPFVPMLSLIGAVIGGILSIVSGVLLFLNPIIEMLTGVFSFFGAIIFDLVFPLQSMAGVVNLVNYTMTQFNTNLISRMVDLNNGIVKFVRNIPGMKKFGKILDADDFKITTEATDENTEVTRENTEAVRDLAREFRNLPQFYKGAAATYAAQDPERNYGNATQGSASVGLGLGGGRGTLSGRFRT